MNMLRARLPALLVTCRRSPVFCSPRVLALPSRLKASEAATFVHAKKTANTPTLAQDPYTVATPADPVTRKKSQDIKTSWLELLVSTSPRWTQPYLRLMRVERPIGTWLTLLPGLWALAAAAPAGALPDPQLAALFCSGAFLMRGFGCTINDMWDRDIDRQVERTRQRPLAAGHLSRWDALWFAGGQAGLAALVLLQLNWHSVMLGLASVGVVVVYPVMKRFTYWPQAVLAIVFNWGALLGFSAVQGASMNWVAALSMYSAAFSWTLIYDTIYAHQDKKDDLLVGTKSTALRFGARTPLWLGTFGASMTASLVAAGLAEGMGWPYFVLTAASSGLLARQVATLKIDDPTDCAKKFVAHRNIGLLILLGCITGSLLKEA